MCGIRHQFNLAEEGKVKTINTITYLFISIKQFTLKERSVLWFTVFSRIVTKYYTWVTRK